MYLLKTMNNWYSIFWRCAIGLYNSDFCFCLLYCPKSSRQVFKYLNRNFLFPQEHWHIFFQLIGQNIAKRSPVGKTEADNKNRSAH